MNYYKVTIATEESGSQEIYIAAATIGLARLQAEQQVSPECITWLIAMPLTDDEWEKRPEGR